MRLALVPHSDSPTPAGLAVTCEAMRSAGGRLDLDWRLTGPLAAIWLPPPGPGGREDELWRTSCLEAFVADGGTAYHEFNFSPSTAWAAYAFDDWRSGRRDATEIAAPRITAAPGPDSWAMRVELDLAPLAAPVWHVGLSAVIEDMEGRLSYWALAHAVGRPDFHARAGFTLELTEAA